MQSFTRVAGLGLLLGVLGCGGAQDTSELNQANRDGTNDNGTRLQPGTPAGAPMCTGMGMGTATLTGTLTSTAAADAAVITASVDGGAEVQVGVINPQDFSKGGRDKTAPYSVKVTVPGDGKAHSVVLCFTQAGSQGRHPKRTCTAPIPETVNCTPPPPPPPPPPPAPPPPTPGVIG